MARNVAYTYYADEYHGTIVAEDAWAHVSQVASACLERIKTLATVTPYGDADECESMATCAMAETVQAWEDIATEAGGGVTSERIGSVSVSYASAAEAFPQGFDRALRDAIAPWLHVCLVVR